MSYDAIDQLEQSVIGAVLINADTLSLLPTLVTADFQNYRPMAVWEAIRNLEATNRPIDVTTIGAELEQVGKLESVGFAWLGQCAMTVPTVTNAIEYARRLKDYSLRRRLLETLQNVVDEGKNGELTGAEMLSATLGIATSLDAESPESAALIGVVVQGRLTQIEQQHTERKNGGRTMTGYPTGVKNLDEVTAGWQPGIVSIIAARPAMGKSSLGLSTADACSAQGHGTHVFSLEDTEASYADRSLSRGSGVDAESLRTCNLNREQFGSIQEALRKLSRRQGWLFDGRSGITAEEIVRSVRRRKRDNKTKVVIVDYIQLVKRPPRMSPHEALGEIITTFADAAKQDGLAYVVMSQLNRQLESRDDKRPMLSDLRESGSLEERSKCVVGVYRGSVYGSPVRNVDYECNCPSKAKEHHCKPPSDADFEAQVQLLILKNSNGRTGVVNADWHGPTTRMS